MDDAADDAAAGCAGDAGDGFSGRGGGAYTTNAEDGGVVSMSIVPLFAVFFFVRRLATLENR